MTMNRREAIQRLSILLGGVLSAEITAGLYGQVTNAGPSVAPDAARDALLAEICDTLIPTTDTPGAKAAGAHQFIIRVIRDCHELDAQKKFYDDLAKFDAECRSKQGKGFAELDPAGRNEAVKRLAQKDKAFFKQLRQLTVTGYFTSEIGATQALAYLPIPGRFEGDVPLKPGQKVWAI